jgi:hypothetical protein
MNPPIVSKSKKPKVRSLSDLRPLIQDGSYRVGPHAAKHALCEGFTEKDMVACLLYGRELLRYTQDQRLLILGYIYPSPSIKIPLHVVVDYAKPKWVDVVTAFIPQQAYQITSRARLAEILRYDRHEPREETVGPNAVQSVVLRYVRV